MVLPDEAPAPEPVIVAPGLAANNGGMDVDVVMASDFDGGCAVPAAVGCTGAMQAQAPCLTASEALSHSPVRHDATDGDEQAMGEIAVDVGKLRAAKPADERDGENGDVELNLLLNALTLDQRQRADEMNMEILQLVDAMGGSKSKYARERRGAVKRLVSEIYSPPRVTAALKLLPSLGCVPGFAMDLTTVDEHGNPGISTIRCSVGERENELNRKSRCC